MQITRRNFALGGLALGGLMATGARASITFGGMTIEMISDGNLIVPADFVIGANLPPEIAAIAAAHGSTGPTLTPPCNLTLLRHDGRVVLFDAGAGPDFMPSAGKLPETLDALGISPEDITHLLLTHGHPDHLWGIVDDFDDPFFPNAEIMMGRAEFDYWADPNTQNTITSARQTMAAGALRRLEALGDQITLFDDGDEVLPGIAARATFGHTPGHMAFELRDGSQAVMVVGDALGNPHVAFEAPGFETGSDQDGALAVQTRLRLLDQITTDGMRVAGFHLPGGLGRVERTASAYRFVAE